jgi:hypothetical protein
MQSKRGTTPSTVVAPEVGLSHSAWLRLEGAVHRPSVDTARKLARWLGWTVEQVLDAAEAPAPHG